MKKQELIRLLENLPNDATIKIEYADPDYYGGCDFRLEEVLK